MNGSILATYSLQDDLFLLCLKGKHHEISALITFSDFVSSYRPVARGGGTLSATKNEENKKKETKN